MRGSESGVAKPYGKQAGKVELDSDHLSATLRLAISSKLHAILARRVYVVSS